MSYYILTFKKGETVLELKSADTLFVFHQLNKCFEEIGTPVDTKTGNKPKKAAKKTKITKQQEVSAVETTVAPAKDKNTVSPASQTVEEHKVITKEIKIEENITVATPPVKENVKEAIPDPVEVETKEISQEISAEEKVPEVEVPVAENPEIIFPEPKILEPLKPEVTAAEICEPEAPAVEEEQPKAEQLKIISADEPPKKVIEFKKKNENVAMETEEVANTDNEDEIVLKLKEETPQIKLVQETVSNVVKEINIEEIVKEETEAKQKETTIEEDVDNLLFSKPSEDTIQNNKFYQILKEKFTSLPGASKDAEELPIKPAANTVLKFKEMDEIVNFKKPSLPLDYLMITAYYLKECAMLDRYSLKQINGKLVDNYIQKPIDHSVIQEAVSRGYLEVVPDYTGMADVTEYAITSDGENFVLNEL